MKILKFSEYIKEESGYLPQFIYTGVNFGPETVSKSMPRTSHDPQVGHKDTSAIAGPSNIMLYSEITNKYYDKYQVEDILREYNRKMIGKKNIINSVSTTEVLDYILRVLETTK